MKQALAFGFVAALLFAGRGEATNVAPLHSERNGIGLKARTASGVVSSTAVTVDPRRSLAVTDKAILSKFLLKDVLDKLITQNGNTGLTSEQLFRQLWDTQNPSPGQADLTAVTTYPRCSDNGNKLNGFNYVCRPSEGAQASATATIKMSDYQAVGLFNRFDLMDEKAVHCGEYRIVFAKKNTTTGSNFIIFEGALPLPTASWQLGHEGCRPVAKFWADLTADADINSRATKLKSFYFTGLPGFPPVVHVTHYGDSSGTLLGQVRTNQFIAGPWMLREFKLQRKCPTATTCTLKFVPVTVKATPAGSLFNPNNTSTLAQQFQAHLVTQVKALATNDVNRFFYTVPAQYKMGQSDSQTPGSTEDDYVAQFNAAATSPFRTKLQNELKRIGSTLTPVNIVARAQALSCGGCHRRSSGAQMGGFAFPSPVGFVHSSDKDDPAAPSRFQLSPALVNTFLPHRKAVLEDFLKLPVTGAAPIGNPSVALTATPGQTLPVKITMANRGSLLWSGSNSISLIPVSSHKWGFAKVDMAAGAKVFHDQETTFTFNVVAPTVPGTYAFQWSMARNGTAFGTKTAPMSITVK